MFQTKTAAPPAPAPGIRTATAADREAILALQARSLRALGRPGYSEAEIESYLRHTPTLEDYLLADATYFVAERNGRLEGCGGWSLKSPAYGFLAREPGPNGNGRGPRVRAMYVDPASARRGVGRRLLETIEAAIVQAGFAEARLEATLSGIPLYERCGYRPVGETEVVLPDGVCIRFVGMHKRLADVRGGHAAQAR